MLEMTTDFDFPVTKRLSAKELKSLVNLFEHRAALFFTPTKNVPAVFVGNGIFDVVIPRSIPNFISTMNNAAYRMPRLWVDELQKITGKIRWTPMSPAKVTIYSYDNLNTFDMSLGGKALLDALKEQTYGRSDGKCLYYFGVIKDDSPLHIDLEQIVDLRDPTLSGNTRIVVEPVCSLSGIGSFRRVT